MYNSQQLKYYALRFIKNEAGAIAVMFAIMLPMILMFYSMAFDGAKIQSERARLADGLNQGVLAIAVIDNRNKTPDDTYRNKQILRNYLQYYIPNADFSENDLNVTVDYHFNETNKHDLVSVDYSASGSVTVHPVISSKTSRSALGFNRNIPIQADGSAGVVKRTYAKKAPPTDYVFVAEFTAKSLQPSSEPGMNRLELLKSVVKEFANGVLQESQVSTFGFVPYSVGVAMATNKKNVAGGNDIACSFAGKLLPEYKGVNLDFWYNKTTQFYNDKKSIIWEQNRNLYNYYKSVVGPATGKSFDQMVEMGWCEKNKDPSLSSEVNSNNFDYICDMDPRSRISEHEEEFMQNLSAAQKLTNSVRIDLTTSNAANIYTFDFDATFNKDPSYIFSTDAITTFTLFPNAMAARFLAYMCNTAVKPGRSPDTLKLTKPYNYLIELTSDPLVLNQIEEMTVPHRLVGTADISSGLLRSLPIIAKGTNERKIIIIISSGTDYNEVFSEKLITEYKACDRIRSGLLKYPSGTHTNEADIYFISLVDDQTSTSNEMSRLNLWTQKCTGEQNAFIATNHQELVDILNKISRKSSISFINKRDE